MEDHVDAVLFLQLRNDDLDVKLALAGDEELLGLLVAAELDGRILFDDASDGDAEFVLIAARLRLDRERNRGLGVVMCSNDRVLGGGQRVAGVDVLRATAPVSPARSSRPEPAVCPG
jgi:hypothetical protein